MKILSISHSMVHQRQQWFFRKLGKLAGQCIIVGPAVWNNLHLEDFANRTFSSIALHAHYAGDIFKYILRGTEAVIDEIEPDIVYCQAELRSTEAFILANQAKLKNIPFVIFVWENIFPVQTQAEKEILQCAAAVICGNQEAKLLIPEEFQHKCFVLPQVGIELDYFKPWFNIPQKYDVVFCGRPVAEKGIDIIKEGCKDLNCSLNIISGQDYEKIPKLLCEGKIFASLPIATSTWKEQSGSYSNLEAMACGLPVITTRCGAIPEYLGETALYCEENNVESFKLALQHVLFNKGIREKHIDLGFQTATTFSNENVAVRLIEVLKKCISETR